MRAWYESVVIGLSALGVLGAVVVSVSTAERYVYGLDGASSPLTSVIASLGTVGQRAAVIENTVLVEEDVQVSATTTLNAEDAPDGADDLPLEEGEEEHVVPQNSRDTDTFPDVLGKQFLSTDEARELLALHNAARREKGIAPLSLAPYLTESAQEWANTLASRGCVLEHSESGYGENIYYSRKYGSNQTPREPQEVMQAFLDEALSYDYASNVCTGEVCGHYTQIMWADTERVGCAKSLCLSDEREEIWVCHYDPQGNIDGQSPY